MLAVAGLACYVAAMSPSTKRLLEQVESWPPEDQEELAEYAREIEARRTGVYTMSDDERAAVRAGDWRKRIAGNLSRTMSLQTRTSATIYESSIYLSGVCGSREHLRLFA